MRRDPCLQFAVLACGLLVPLAQLAQQPRVFHRDDRLRREVLEKGDLFVGERLYLSPIHDDCALQSVVLTQGNCAIERIPAVSANSRNR